MDNIDQDSVRVKCSYLKNKLIIICGPTASGKTKLALKLAEQLNGQIIGADSIQMYRGFDIGAAKPTQDEQSRIPHHMVNILDWNDPYDAGKYCKQARSIIASIFDQNQTPIVVGGSGLYIRALLGQHFNLEVSGTDQEFLDKLHSISEHDLYVLLMKLDPLRAKKIHPNDRYRIQRALLIMHLTGQTVTELEQNSKDTSLNCPRCWIYIKPDKSVLWSTIEQRVSVMFDQGFVDEVKALLASGCSAESKPMQSIGYKEVCSALISKDMSDLKQKVIIATRQYAKRQMTWFNKVDYDILIKSPSDLILED